MLSTGISPAWIEVSTTAPRFCPGSGRGPRWTFPTRAERFRAFAPRSWKRPSMSAPPAFPWSSSRTGFRSVRVASPHHESASASPLLRRDPAALRGTAFRTAARDRRGGDLHLAAGSRGGLSRHVAQGHPSAAQGADAAAAGCGALSEGHRGGLTNPALCLGAVDSGGSRGWAQRRARGAGTHAAAWTGARYAEAFADSPARSRAPGGHRRRGRHRPRPRAHVAFGGIYPGPRAGLDQRFDRRRLDRHALRRPAFIPV